MAYSSDQLDALRSAMAEGVQSVQFADGRRVVFRDLAEMQQLERVMVGDLGAAAVAAGSGTTPMRRYRLGFRRS